MRRQNIVWALALGLSSLTVPAALRAVAPATDAPQLPISQSGTPDIDFGSRPANSNERPPAGNPLWAIPLESLSVTRERPIFSPSRRVPTPVVLPRPQPAAPAPQPPVVQLERPQMLLVGTILHEQESIAIVVDQGTRNVVRLRVGQGHSGWILRGIEGRAITLQKGLQVESLALPKTQDNPVYTDPDTGLPQVAAGDATPLNDPLPVRNAAGIGVPQPAASPPPPRKRSQNLDSSGEGPYAPGLAPHYDGL